MVDLVLEPELLARLDVLGRLRDQSPDVLVRQAIEDFLAREEAHEAERRDDEARWERYTQSGVAIPLDRVVAWLDSIGTDQELPPPR